MVRRIPADHPTIAAALAAAAAGDTIVIAAGTYAEGNLTVNKSLTIEGAGTTADPVVSTVITPAGAQDGFRITADGVTLRRMRVVGGATGVVVDSWAAPLVGVLVENCYLTLNAICVSFTGANTMGAVMRYCTLLDATGVAVQNATDSTILAAVNYWGYTNAHSIEERIDSAGNGAVLYTPWMYDTYDENANGLFESLTATQRSGFLVLTAVFRSSAADGAAVDPACVEVVFYAVDRTTGEIVVHPQLGLGYMARRAVGVWSAVVEVEGIGISGLSIIAAALIGGAVVMRALDMQAQPGFVGAPNLTTTPGPFSGELAAGG